MIYELRTYTVKPGTIGDMVKAASTVSRDIRKDDFGKLEGYWLTEIGLSTRSCTCGATRILRSARDCVPNSPRTRAGPASMFR